MKKLFAFILVFLLAVASPAAADIIKLTSMAAETSPGSDTLIYGVIDPSGTPADRKIALSAAITKGHGLSDGGILVVSGVMTSNANLATYAGITPSANTQSFLAAADYAAMRALLDLEPGTDFYSVTAADAAFEPKDALLTSIAGLTTAADQGLYFTASDTASVYTLTSFARTILDDTDAATVRATIGAVGTSGNETIAGVKTFSSFPVTPSSAPTSDYEVANKKYVDDISGAATFLGLTDTPSAYTGHALEYPRVNSTEDGIEFVAGTSTPWIQPITKDSPTASTYRWFKADAALTVTGFDVILAASDTGTITVDVQECTATGTSCVSILSAPVTATATGASATITDTSIAADAWVQIVYGTPSGTVSQVAATLKGTR